MATLEDLLEIPKAAWALESTSGARKLAWEAMKALINFSLSADGPEQELEGCLEKPQVEKSVFSLCVAFFM